MSSSPATLGEQLCLACGLCCDGTLFGHVRLGGSDDAKRLKALDLPLLVSRTRPPVIRFRQPCAALCSDLRCRVYADRPAQCRAFECRVYQAVRDGQLDVTAARARVKRARRRADKVRLLLRALGDTNEHCSLDERFRNAQQRLESGQFDASDGEHFAELTQAMHAWHLLAHDVFHTHPPER